MDVSVDISLLILPTHLGGIVAALAQGTSHFSVENIACELVIAHACETENVFVDEYWRRFGHAPEEMEIYRFIINGNSDLPLAKVTRDITAILPADQLWYGSAEIGHTEFGLGTVLAFQRVN